MFLEYDLSFSLSRRHTFNGCMAQFERGFGSVGSIHSHATVPPALVSLPVVIITFHKYSLGELA